MEFIYRIDFGILNWLQSLHFTALDWVMEIVTHLADKGAFWLALGLVLCFPRKTRKWGASMLFAVAIGFLVTNLTIKPFVFRARPFWSDGPFWDQWGMYAKDQLSALSRLPFSMLPEEGDPSFPSGHTTASVAAALAMFLRNKKWGSWALALAVLIAVSRCYLYIHFPTDVLVGAIIGTCAALLSVFILNKLTESKRFSKIMNWAWDFSLAREKGKHD